METRLLKLTIVLRQYGGKNSKPQNKSYLITISCLRMMPAHLEQSDVETPFLLYLTIKVLMLPSQKFGNQLRAFISCLATALPLKESSDSSMLSIQQAGSSEKPNFPKIYHKKPISSISSILDISQSSILLFWKEERPKNLQSTLSTTPKKK